MNTVNHAENGPSGLAERRSERARGSALDGAENVASGALARGAGILAARGNGAERPARDATCYTCGVKLNRLEHNFFCKVRA